MHLTRLSLLTRLAQSGVRIDPSSSSGAQRPSAAAPPTSSAPVASMASKDELAAAPSTSSTPSQAEAMASVASMEESAAPTRATGEAAPFLPGDWICRTCGNHNFQKRGFCNGNRTRCQEPHDGNFKPGDWYCLCGNFNFASKQRCNRSICRRWRHQGEQIP